MCDVEPRFLRRIELQLMMEHLMKLDPLRRGAGEQRVAQEHAGDSGQERYQRDDNRPAKRLHRLAVNSVEGASGLDGPKGDNVSGAADAGGLAVAIPTISAATAAVAPMPIP